MYRRVVSQSIGLGLLVALIVLALNACGGGEEEARPLPQEEQALQPGTYLTQEFEPAFSFTVGEGWSTLAPEASDDLRLIYGEESGIRFVKFQDVYEPTRTGTPNLVEPPEDMVGWLEQHPHLQTDNPEPVAIGGVEGKQLEGVVGDLPEDYYGVCGRECVDLGRVSDDATVSLSGGSKGRLIVLEDVEGETVTIASGSPATEFDEFAPEAQEVLDSVEWRGS